MNRQLISAIAHTGHPICAPLSDASVSALLDRAITRGDERLLDLGCAEATWLIRALTAHPGLRGEGVDLAPGAIAGAREAVEAAGVGDRVALHQLDARKFTAKHPFDLVLSIGASHAYGGLLPTLEAAGELLAPGGSVLVGDGFWEREPDQATLTELDAEPDDYHDLATTVAQVGDAGWTPVHGHVSSLAEWDDYEWSWTGSLARWALDHPEHPVSGEALQTAQQHQRGWLAGYRGTLGFVTLLLRRTEE